MNSEEFLEELIDTCSNCRDDDWDALRLVGLLLSQEGRASLDLSSALDSASESGDNVKLVRLLLSDPRVDPSYDESSSLMMACENGRDRIVHLLLQDGRADPNAGDGLALDLAIENENNAVARLLLADERVDPTLNWNKALFGAIHDCNYEMIRLLLSMDSVTSCVDWSDMLGHAEETGDATTLELVRSRIPDSR